VENYFNYFTEIEECFQRARGLPTMLSTLDWALIESWKEADVPLEAVLAGINRAFEKFHKRPRPYRKVNSLAYCSQAVMRAAEAAPRAGSEGARTRTGETEAPFTKEAVLAFILRNAEILRKVAIAQSDQDVLARDLQEAAGALERLAQDEPQKLEDDPQELERYLAALEEKLAASLTRASSPELLATFRGEIERAIVLYRRNLGGAEIESLERQFIKKRLFEHYHIPRLSLFYL
jgi:hypothetical protein